MPATDPSPALTADQALAQAKTFANHAEYFWRQGGSHVLASAAAQISIAFGQIANLEQMRAWEAEN